MILILLLVLAILVAVGTRRLIRARRGAARDDLRRVGDSGDIDGHAAARRAQGRNAWNRMGGF